MSRLVLRASSPSAAGASLRDIRLWAREDAAEARCLHEHIKFMRQEAAEKRAIKKAREAEKAQEIERLNKLVHGEVERLRRPRRIMMWNENNARGSILLEALETILGIQSQMIAAFLTLIDKKVPLLLPGARLSTAEENRTLQDFFPKTRRAALLPPTNHGVQKKASATVPCIFSKRRVSFNAADTVIVFRRTPTPSTPLK